jgi:hypothetical protein
MTIAIDALKRIADISRPENPATNRLYQVHQIAVGALRQCEASDAERVLAELWRNIAYRDRYYLPSDLVKQAEHIVTRYTNNTANRDLLR